MAQVSKRIIKKQLKDKLEANLLTALAEIKTKPEAQEFLTNLLSPTEKTMLTKRFGIALLLDKGGTYQQIIDALRVSPPTINKVSHQLRKNKKLFSRLGKRLQSLSVK